jgi:WD40 repeat protein
VTARQAGPTIAQNLWGGVLRYTFTTDDAGPGDAGGIDASEVADPVGLAFRPTSSEVFVGNRHGNNAGDGVAGSVSRFVWNGAAQTLTPNGTITGNGLNSVTQVAFNPVSGELFAADFGGAGGVSRFTFDSQGNAMPNGTIGSGAALGVNVSPDGKRLYLTVNSSSNISQFDLSSGTQLTPVTVSGTTNLQQIALRGSSELYIASGISNTVFRFTLDALDNPTLVESITGADAPVGVAFSPDGLQMFTGGHLNTDIIDRYQYNAQSDSWMPTSKFNAPASLGYFLILGDLSSGGGSTVDAASE